MAALVETVKCYFCGAMQPVDDLAPPYGSFDRTYLVCRDAVACDQRIEAKL